MTSSGPLETAGRRFSAGQSEAQRIVYLGFHFHDQNVEILRSQEPARGGTVNSYATAFKRSTPEIQIIDEQIRAGLGKRGGSWNVYIAKDVDCAGLFREYGTAFAR
jgi:hypothetical protein